MKNLILLIMLLTSAIGLATAQDSIPTSRYEKSYNRFMLDINLRDIHGRAITTNYYNVKKYTEDGVTAGIGGSVIVGKEVLPGFLPHKLIIEGGGSANLLSGLFWRSEEDGKSTYDFYPSFIFNIKIPLSLRYRINIKDNWSISPMFGVNATVNVLFLEWNGSKWENLHGSSTLSSNYINRFQIGWQGGILAEHKNLIYGLQYEHDITPLVDITANPKNKVRFNTFGIKFSIGKKF